jgi:hypothetical protein
MPKKYVCTVAQYVIHSITEENFQAIFSKVVDEVFFFEMDYKKSERIRKFNTNNMWCATFDGSKAIFNTINGPLLHDPEFRQIFMRAHYAWQMDQYKNRK